MATGDRVDPYRGYRFRIEIDGIDRGGFREASGLDSAQDPIEYREGTEPLTVRKLPGLNKYSNITLKWGTTDDAALWEWRKKCIDGKVERKNGSVILSTTLVMRKHAGISITPGRQSGPGRALTPQVMKSRSRRSRSPQ